MGDRDALLAAVRADPDADTPRLVYADWLDDQGEPADAARAAFIRHQVAQTRAEPYSPAARAAGEAARKLYAEHHRAWTDHLPGWAGYEFARGFVDEVTAAAIDLPAVAEAAFAAEPVTGVRIGRTRPDDGWAAFEPVFDVPELARVRRLALLPGLLASVVYEALAESPHLADLDDLSLGGNPVPGPWLTAFLCESGRLPHLTGLDLSDIPNIGGDIARGLGRTARRLARLNLSGVFLTSSQLKAVVESPALREVEELRLGRLDPSRQEGPLCHLNMGWVLPWDRLRLLDLTGQGVGDAGAAEIAGEPAAAGLRWLGLRRNGLRADGVRRLVGAGHLHLYHLDVRDNGLGPPELAALRQRFPAAAVLG